MCTRDLGLNSEMADDDADTIWQRLYDGGRILYTRWIRKKQTAWQPAHPRPGASRSALELAKGRGSVLHHFHA